MVAYQIIIQLILIFLVQNVLNAQEISVYPENVFTIDDQTTIRFSIPKEKFYYSNVIDESTDIRDVQSLRYLPHSEFTGFQSNRKYIKKLKIKNLSKTSETISVIAGLGHLNTEFILVSDNKVTNFTNDSGTNRNYLSSINPVITNFQKLMPRNFTFEVLPDESVDFYYKFQMPSRGFAFDSRLIFFDTEKYQENRRFGLWLEGIILGSILGLLVFSIYSYYQIRDKTTLYFCFWLITAVLVIVGQFHHDGIRLLEFLIEPVKDNYIFADISFASRFGVFTGYVQAMMFVIFARQFINLKKYLDS